MRFLTILINFVPFLPIKSEVKMPERSATYMMNNQFATIIVYARGQDFVCIKSLFVEYPKELDTNYLWLPSLPILVELRFKTHFAYYEKDEYGREIGIMAYVTYTLNNHTVTEYIHTKKNIWVSITEWQIENPMLDLLLE
ncbi:hypothetical protein L3Y34_003544 [Caenorhabditis briggsae]|uniref:Uncharacterized protein n=1 Tax=Caenorhabditis briggsae TaxID=6238 RepID=A0AAE9A9P9_CAEBR|nr:hypothetical protein L3Y34_003544 [Caenorhabditis briggsae]